MNFQNLLDNADFIGRSLVPPKTGQMRVLSDRVRLKLRNSKGKLIDFGEIDSFKCKKRDSIRTFKPAGSTREIGLISDGGWELSISGGKIDWKLARLMYTQETMVNTHTNNELPDPLFYAASFFFSVPDPAKLANIAPKWQLEKTITYYDFSIETYIFEDVTLYNFEQNIDSDLSAITESVMGFSPRITLSDTSSFSDEFLTKKARRYVVDEILAEQDRNYRYSNTPGKWGDALPFNLPSLPQIPNPIPSVFPPLFD